jgi:hypothetical protein
VKKAYNRFGVYDEDQELIRIFHDKESADAFCLTNWTVTQLPAKQVQCPLEKVGDAPF